MWSTLDAFKTLADAKLPSPHLSLLLPSQDVGARALPILLGVLEEDAQDDVEMAKAVVETMSLLCEVEEIDGRVRGIAPSLSHDTRLRSTLSHSPSEMTRDSATPTSSFQPRHHFTPSSPSSPQCISTSASSHSNSSGSFSQTDQHRSNSTFSSRLEVWADWSRRWTTRGKSSATVRPVFSSASPPGLLLIRIFCRVSPSHHRPYDAKRRHPETSRL